MKFGWFMYHFKINFYKKFYEKCGLKTGNLDLF